MCVAQDSQRTLITNSDYYSNKGLTIWSIQRDSNEVVKYIDSIKLDLPSSRTPEDDCTYTSPQKIHGLFIVNGRVFLCAWETLWVLDNKKGHWIASYIDIETHGEKISDSVYDVVQFGQRTLIATYEGLYQLDSGSNKPTPVPGTADVVITRITVIGHRAYLGGSAALSLDEGASKAKPIPGLGGVQALCFAQVGPRLLIAEAPTATQPSRIAIMEENQPLRWIAMDQPSCWITDIAASRDGRAIIATNQGIYTLDEKSNIPQLSINCGGQTIFGLPKIKCAGQTALAIIQAGKATQLWNIDTDSCLFNDEDKDIEIEDKRFLTVSTRGVAQIPFEVLAK